MSARKPTVADVARALGLSSVARETVAQQRGLGAAASAAPPAAPRGTLAA